MIFQICMGKTLTTSVKVILSLLEHDPLLFFACLSTVCFDLCISICYLPWCTFEVGNLLPVFDESWNLQKTALSLCK